MLMWEYGIVCFHFHNVRHEYASDLLGWFSAVCRDETNVFKKRCSFKETHIIRVQTCPLIYTQYTVCSSAHGFHITGVLWKSPMIVDCFTKAALMKIYCLVLGNTAQQSIRFWRLILQRNRRWLLFDGWNDSRGGGGRETFFCRVCVIGFGLQHCRIKLVQEEPMNITLALQ